MLRDQTMYQIWPKSNNPRRSYWWFSHFVGDTSRCNLNLKRL